MTRCLAIVTVVGALSGGASCRAPAPSRAVPAPTWSAVTADRGFFAWNRQGVFASDAATAAWEGVVHFLRTHAGQPVAPRPTAPSGPAGNAGGEAQHLQLHG